MSCMLRPQIWALIAWLTTGHDRRNLWRRLYAMGVITTKKSLVQLEKLSTASFCRRRLAVVMVRLKMSETLREAATFIEQARRLPTRQAWLGFLLHQLREHIVRH